MTKKLTYEELERQVLKLKKADREHKQAEEALKKSESQLRQIIDLVPHFIFVKDETGKFEIVNKATAEVFGTTVEDLTGRRDVEFVATDEEMEHFRSDDLEVINSGKAKFIPEEPMTDSENNIRYLQTTKVPFKFSATNKPSLLGVAVDITRRKQVENDLLESEKKLHTLLNATTDIAFLAKSDGTCLACNNAFVESLGTEKEKCIGKNIYTFLPGKISKSRKVVLESIIASKKPFQWKDGHSGKYFHNSVYPILDKMGNVHQVACFAKNITDQRQAEEGQKRLACAIDQTSEVVIITDPEGIIQYVNPAFVELTGYSPEEAVGQNPAILQSGRLDRAFYKRMWTTLLRGEVWSGHMINKKKDGSLFEEEATISPVKDNQGQIINFVAVKRDVSREVSLEKQLRQSMKMEAIGTLAGGIAHDFNNILSAILGYSEIAKSQLPAADPIGKDLDQVIKAGERATELVKQILAFSRQGEEDFKPLKVQLILKEVLKLLRASLPTTIQLKESIVSNSGSILADPTQIHQVLMNLCTNAKHAIGEEIGTLSISLSEIRVTEEKIIDDCPQIRPGLYLYLEISDTGCGMDELTRLKIFDPFFTTKEKGKGTGLGLAVVHGIIKQHKGEITVTSEPGRGTLFHVYLPVIDEEIPSKHARYEETPRGNKERILLVDDDTAIAEMMRRTLENLGYFVTISTSSTEALNAYQKNPRDFNLVITDMTMPEMTGIDLTRKLLILRPDLPVILCTGFSETINETSAKSFGICEYIRKPVSKLTLAKAIRSALARVS